MEEAYRRCVASCKDRGLRQSIKAGSRGTQAAVRHVCGTPIGGIIIAAPPCYGVFPRLQFVKTCDPSTFDAPQLLDRAAFGSRLSKAHRIHLAHDFEPRVIIECETRLIEQAIGTSTAWLTGRVQPHACFANPDEKRASASSKDNGRMTNPRARLKHETGEPTDRNMGPYTVLVHDDEGTVENVELALFDEKNRRAFLHRDRAWRRATRHGARRNHWLLLINMRHLALPNPAASAGKNSSGASTVMSPSRSSTPNSIGFWR